MDPLTVIALVRAAAQTAHALAPLIEQAKEALGSDDAGELQAAAEQLAAANDALHERLQNKLAAAAQRG